MCLLISINSGFRENNSNTSSKCIGLIDILFRICLISSKSSVLSTVNLNSEIFVSFSTIVRITADCPLIDPQIVDKVIEQFFSGNYDFATNTLTRTFPIGTDVEVFSFSALKRTWESAQLPSEREHVTPYLRNERNFKIINVQNDKNISSLRLTVDRIEDFELIKQILKNISVNPIHLGDVLELFSRKPELIEINKHIDNNEGFSRSLKEDQEFIKKQKK